MNKSLVKLNQAIIDHPNNCAMWYERGEILANSGNYPEALKSFDRVLELQPDRHTAWVFRSVILIHLERYEEALTSCEMALSLQPANSEAWLFRGVALQRLRRYPEAYTSYDRALGMEHPVPRQTLGQVVKQFVRQLKRSLVPWRYLNSDQGQ